MSRYFNILLSMIGPLPGGSIHTNLRCRPTTALLVFRRVCCLPASQQHSLDQSVVTHSADVAKKLSVCVWLYLCLCIYVHLRLCGI